MKTAKLSDADRAIFERSARSIALQVAALSLGMIVVGGTLVSLAVWWKWRHDWSIDWLEFGLEAMAGGLVAVAIAGIAAFFFAHRATRPLADALSRQRNFVADASHELRTPLTVMYARVQQLAALSRTHERIHPVALELKTDTEDMIAIVEELLQLATVSTFTPEVVDLDGVFAKIEAEAEVSARSKDITFTVAASSLWVSAPPIALHRALSALVDNAVKHTPAGGWIDVTARALGGEVEIRVDDSGPGITGVEPDRVFERFASGTGGTGGSHGIGLALVHDTIARSGGTVRVERTGPDGTCFLITLPQGRPA